MLKNSLRKMLIVEFRDEVYADLQAMLREMGVAVERATYEATVPAIINRLKPDLVLIHEEMPYESGWLIACKLAFSHPGQAVWLYGARSSDRLAQRQRVCGVDEFIAYGGVLSRLAEQLREAVWRWRKGASSPSPAARCERRVDDAPRRSEACLSDLERIVFDPVHKEVYHEEDAFLDRVADLCFDPDCWLPLGQEYA
jgi:DNA-binding response OmpR family regulator